MQKQILNVMVEVSSSSGDGWQRISSGTWEPGADVQLRLHGEPIPEEAADTFASLPYGGEESGTHNVQLGDVRFRFTWHR